MHSTRASKKSIFWGTLFERTFVCDFSFKDIVFYSEQELTVA